MSMYETIAEEQKVIDHLGRTPLALKDTDQDHREITHPIYGELVTPDHSPAAWCSTADPLNPQRASLTLTRSTTILRPTSTPPDPIQQKTPLGACSWRGFLYPEASSP